MCFALPMKIASIKGNVATSSTGKKVKLDLVEKCQVGDYTLVQADLAIEKISARRAKEIAKRLKEFNK